MLLAHLLLFLLSSNVFCQNDTDTDTTMAISVSVSASAVSRQPVGVIPAVPTPIVSAACRPQCAESSVCSQMATDRHTTQEHCSCHTEGSYGCQSANRVVQVRDPCHPNPCANNAVCQIDDQLQAVCVCQSSCEHGVWCEQVLSPCDSHSCAAPGKCAVDANCMPFCQCPYGFTGDQCQFASSCQPCDQHPCQNGGVCVNQPDGTFACQCHPNGRFTGPLCAQAKNPCLQYPCPNSEKCHVQAASAQAVCSPDDKCTGKCDLAHSHCAINEQGPPTCVCHHKWRGARCDRPKSACEPNPCLYGAQCTATDTGGFKCSCPPHQKGPMCERCSPCQPSPCHNGGVCFETAATQYKCVCPSAWTGANCMTYARACHHLICVNGGTCQLGATDGTASCQCATGFHGRNCEHRDLCTDLQPCAPDGTANCQNTVNGTFKCQCKDGHFGYKCQFHKSQLTGATVCHQLKPCVNGGICQQRADPKRLPYKCRCAPNFWGVDCQWNHCSPNQNPCWPGGVCHLDSDGQQRCDCDDMHSGEFCEMSDIRKCHKLYCHASGKCHRLHVNQPLSVQNVRCVCQSSVNQLDVRCQPLTTPALPAVKVPKAMNATCDILKCPHAQICQEDMGQARCVLKKTKTKIDCATCRPPSVCNKTANACVWGQSQFVMELALGQSRHRRDTNDDTQSESGSSIGTTLAVVLTVLLVLIAGLVIICVVFYCRNPEKFKKILKKYTKINFFGRSKKKTDEIDPAKSSGGTTSEESPPEIDTNSQSTQKSVKKLSSNKSSTPTAMEEIEVTLRSVSTPKTPVVRVVTPPKRTKAEDLSNERSSDSLDLSSRVPFESVSYRPSDTTSTSTRSSKTETASTQESTTCDNS